MRWGLSTTENNKWYSRKGNVGIVEREVTNAVLSFSYRGSGKTRRGERAARRGEKKTPKFWRQEGRSSAGGKKGQLVSLGKGRNTKR